MTRREPCVGIAGFRVCQANRFVEWEVQLNVFGDATKMSVLEVLALAVGGDRDEGLMAAGWSPPARTAELERSIAELHAELQAAWNQVQALRVAD